MRNQALDSAELTTAALPFDKLTRELDDRPRWVAGQNLRPTPGGKTVLRPGTSRFHTIPSFGQRMDRLVILQTMENPAKIYLLASGLNSSTGLFEMWWTRPDDASPVWTNMGSLRSLNASTKPHEIVVHGGKAYIKAFPAGAGDKLGSVIFDPAASTTARIWGVLGPTVALRMTSGFPGSWPASAHPVTVTFGWKYVYCKHTKSNHLSNRSPLETAPDVNPSDTGPFSDRRPQMTYSGDADTANVDEFWFFRSTDGGGNFFFLDKATNTGAGSFTFEDNKRASGGGNLDPKTDRMLDTRNIAPSEVSNTPPPTVLPPKVIGVDAVEQSTPITSHVGRLWFSIGNRTFFSGNEEIDNGTPTESFPIGISGNHIDWADKVLYHDLWRGLLTVTTKDVYLIQGFNLESFSWGDPLLPGLGGRKDHPRAHLSYRGYFFWLTRDGRIASLDRQGGLEFLSDALGDEILTFITTDAANREIQLEAYGDKDVDFLVVAGIDKTGAGAGKVWVYDLRLGVWHLPYTLNRVSAMVRGQVQESAQQEQLLFAIWNGAAVGLAKLDFAVFTDMNADFTTTNIAAPSATLSLQRVPLGNHIHTLRRPGMVPVVYGIKIDRTKFVSDADPTVGILRNEISGSFTTLALNDPPRRVQSTTYRQLWYYEYTAVERAQFKIDVPAGQKFELQNLAVIFAPESGA